MKLQQEKRKFVRLNALVDVVYDKFLPTEQKKLSLAKNISNKGICLIVYEEMREQDILDLKMCLPESKAPINALGKVVWVKEFVIGDTPKGKRFDVGIEFVKIKREDVNIINKYMFSHI